jgi:hypothetical protein
VWSVAAHYDADDAVDNRGPVTAALKSLDQGGRWLF